MNNFILINRTFTETTPESAEDGEFSDAGMLSENEEVTFSELVQLMREHQQPSNSGEPDTNTWFSSGYHVEDYTTATEREECIHFSKDNTPNAPKYWKLARKFADREIKKYS